MRKWLFNLLVIAVAIWFGQFLFTEARLDNMLPRITISGNNVGIGTTTPGSILSVAGGDAQITGTTTTQSLVATSTAILAKNGGSVGIGSTTPASFVSLSFTGGTSTIHIGTGGSTSFGSCIQLYAASGTAYRLYVDGETSVGGNSALRVEKGGCQDQSPSP